MSPKKVILSDLKILSIIPSRDFGTVEKKALDDAIIHRDAGGSVEVLCLSESLLHRRLTQEEITSRFYAGNEVSRDFDFTLYRDLRKLILENEYDLIQIYDTKYLWPSIVALRGDTKTPLILTTNEVHFPYRKTLVHQWMLRRLDAIFCFTERQREVIAEAFSLPKRKIHVVGMGLDMTPNMINAHQGDTFRFATLVAPHEKDLTGLCCFLDAIKSITMSFENWHYHHKSLRFILGSQVEWVKHPLYRRIVQELELRGLDYKVAMEFVPDIKTWTSSIDVYVNHSFNQAVDWIEVVAQVLAKPVLYPRNGGNYTDASHGQGLIGESYGLENARNLRVSALKIVDNYDKYKDDFTALADEIKNFHGVEEYLRLRSFHFEKLTHLRHRVAAK